MRFLVLIILMIACQTNKKKPYDLPNSVHGSVLFDSGKVKTSNGICFSSDGKNLLISESIDQSFSSGKSMMGIRAYHFENEKWTRGNLLDIAIDAYHPVLSYAGDTLYFNSRAHPDSLEYESPHNIWFSIKKGDGWSSPVLHGVVNSLSYDSYPSVAKNGNLYFNSDREGGLGGMDIYISELKGGEYQMPVLLQQINSEYVENDLVIDPNEQFIIFNRYVFTTQSIDMYISIRKNGQWSDAIPLTSINEPDQWELTPTLSPDGKYFFYEVNSQIWQIKVSDLFEELEGG